MSRSASSQAPLAPEPRFQADFFTGFEAYVFHSSAAGGAPASLAVLLAPARGITAAYATNVLKTLGIHEGNYRIINAGVLSRIYHERVYAALMVLCCVLLICRFPRVLSKMNICIGIMGAAIVLILLRQILTICLGWRDAVSFGGLIQNEFLLKTAPLRNYYQWDAVLFAVFLFLAVSIIIRRFYLWVRR